MRGFNSLFPSFALWWELSLAFMFYSKEPLGHFMWASLNILSLKTALLLPLSSAERVSDQCALFICPSCLLMGEDLTDVTLKSCPLRPTMLKHCLAQGQRHSTCSH